MQAAGRTPVTPALGSQFGTNQGFTPFTVGIAVCPEALYASANAVALTELLALFQMREKNVGKLLRVTVTPTRGLPLAATPVVHTILVIVAGRFEIKFSWAAASASLLTADAEPGPAVLQTSEGLREPGIVVNEEVANMLAPASAAASAARWASPRATYRVTTSIDKAAIPSNATREAATSAMVCPRSPFRWGVRIFMETPNSGSA